MVPAFFMDDWIIFPKSGQLKCSSRCGNVWLSGRGLWMMVPAVVPLVTAPRTKIPCAQIPKHPILPFKTKQEFISTFRTSVTSSYQRPWMICKVNKFSFEYDRKYTISGESNRFCAVFWIGNSRKHFVGGFCTASFRVYSSSFFSSYVAQQYCKYVFYLNATTRHCILARN